MSAVHPLAIFADMSQQHLPWYLKDKWGYPIEFIAGRSAFSRWVRILFINLQKLGARPKRMSTSSSEDQHTSQALTSFRNE